jgi:hypothetical protein
LLRGGKATSPKDYQATFVKEHGYRLFRCRITHRIGEKSVGHRSKAAGQWNPIAHLAISPSHSVLLRTDARMENATADLRTSDHLRKFVNESFGG